jgi:flagellar protein FlgJ
MTSTPFSNQLAIDPQAVGSLHKLANGADSKEGIKAAAKQFEAYFMQMMLRSMRETISQDGPFDSQETKTFTEMFDQQVAQSISQSRGMGLGDTLAAQIEQQMNLIALSKHQPAGQAATAATSPAAGATQSATVQPGQNSAAATNGAFVDKLWPHAVDAAKSLGVAPHLLLGQAALESGWGKHELKTLDGSNSHNLFNLKAGSNWHGPTVDKQVTEYVNGKPVQSTEKFRAYGSYEESFADYAKLLSGNPRYAGALNQDAAGFARGLQQGGYATDPDYGNKLMRVINSPAFRQQLASADAA